VYKVLLVDDDETILERLAAKMPWRDAGFEVAALAAGGESALQQVKRHRPHVVLTDIMMPQMDGLELAKRMRRDYPQVAMAVMSAYDEFAYARDAIKFGVKGYLLKPVLRDEFAELFGRIAAELDAAAAAHGAERPHVVPASQNPYVAAAMRYVYERYEEAVRLETIAGQLHLNANYFSSLFKQETGYSFIDYLNEYRIGRARQLLLRTEDKISDIAVLVGFPNFSHFNRMFKRSTGETPLEYRHSHATIAASVRSRRG